MLNPIYLNSFKKDIKTAKKRGLDTDLLSAVMTLIIEEQPLQDKHNNHKLVGNWKGRWDCHVAPDWLLLYRLEGEDVIFERTGRHTDLF
jgi:mRNA interferase YafQ